ncbi:MAG: hypothetical protein OXF33_10900 [Rhodospirillales bacterium]|nr:hypothetical protein [Rhodospirillales bacterium]
MERPLTGSAAARARPTAGPCSARPGAIARAQCPLPERPRGSLRTFASAPRGPDGAHDITLRFVDVAGDAFEQSTREDWRAPALGDAVPDDFRPPYNDEIRNAYDLLEERLENLRHWRTIDGDPLTIALTAPALAPRQLQVAALSGIAASEAAAALQSALPYSFDTAHAKAREAVGNLMYFGDLLTRGLYRQDELTLDEIYAGQAHHVALDLEQGGQASLIRSMELERAALGKEREEAGEYLRWYEDFAKEYFNPLEATAHGLLGLKAAQHGAAAATGWVVGGLKVLPNVFGLATGGQRSEGLAEASLETWEQTAETLGATAEGFFLHAEAYRRRAENRMERDATRKVVERIDAELARLAYDIGEERGTLEALKVKSANAEALIEFHRRRVTNREFRSWYVGRMATLYDSAYDVTMRFCRLAERAYQVEVGEPTATFIRPSWDAQHRGLLAGQSLMLDLQRMEFAHMQRYRPEVEGSARVSLGKIDPMALEGLKRTGRAVFTIVEAQIDEEMPDEYERRIKSVRATLRGLPGRSGLGGRLVLVGDRVYFDREKSEERSVLNLFGRQQITLSGPDTDTADLERKGGRFLPFERCGVHSTWMISFPAAVKAIEDGRRRSRHRTMLEKLEDVVLEIRYTARIVK